MNTATRSMFKTVEAVDDSINAQGIYVIIEKEADDQWREVRERILPDDETRHDQRLNS